jgi:hypothetical protein
MNPQMAAFYAARNARDGRMAYDSLNEGEAQIDRQVNRSNSLARQANYGRDAALRARASVPSKAAGTAELLKGGLGLAKETGLLKALPGLFKDGYDWLGGQTGLWGNNWFTSDSADSIDW